MQLHEYGLLLAEQVDLVQLLGKELHSLTKRRVCVHEHGTSQEVFSIGFGEARPDKHDLDVYLLNSQPTADEEIPTAIISRKYALVVVCTRMASGRAVRLATFGKELHKSISAELMEALLKPRKRVTRSILEFRENWFLQSSGPDFVQLSCEGRYFTSRAIAARIKLVAAGLHGQGVRVGDTVGIRLAKDERYLFVFLACLKSGYCALPLDPGEPAERQLLKTHRSKPKIVVSDTEFFGFEAVRYDALCADRQADDYGGQLSGTVPAYQMYTSGSTGVPKGVLVSHANVRNLVDHFTDELKSISNLRLLSVTNTTFDISVLELLLPLSSGGVVEIATPSLIGSDSFVERVHQFQPNCVQATPTLWQSILDWHSLDLSCVVALCGGEQLTNTLAKRIIERVGLLVNVYGPTETTIWSTTRTVRCGDLRAPQVTVGGAIFNTTLHSKAEHYPELEIGGAGVALGYVRDSRETARKFIPDPEVTGGRKYRTGDVVEFVEADVRILGRVDNQIKLRGQRIELEDVEANLETIDSIKAAVAQVRNHSLIAYVVANGDFDESSTLESIRRKLPSQMCPVRLIQVDVIPMSTSGKKDRVALVGIGEAPQVAQPRDPEVFYQLVDEILGCDAQPGDSFLDLGGNSLNAAQLAYRLADQSGLHVDIHRILMETNLRQIAGSIAPLNQTVKNFDRITCTAALVNTKEVFEQPALFVLASPRGGSSAVWEHAVAISGGFGAPPLELAPFAELQTERSSGLHVGANAGLSQLLGCEFDADEFNLQKDPITSVYRKVLIQAGQRPWIEKSVLTLISWEAVERLVRMFPQARFVFVTRDPQSCIGSMVRQRYDVVLQSVFPQLAGETPNQIAEWVWYESLVNMRRAYQLVGSRGLLLNLEDEQWRESVQAFLGNERQSLGKIPDYVDVDLFDYTRGKGLKKGVVDQALCQRSVALAQVYGYKICQKSRFATASPISEVDEASEVLLWMPPITGDLGCYATLNGYVPDHVRQIGVSLSPFADLRTLEEVVDDVLAAITNEIGDLPVTICGWSYGAFLALELSQRLYEMDAAPRMLLLLDPTDVSVWAGEDVTTAMIAQLIGAHSSSLCKEVTTDLNRVLNILSQENEAFNSISLAEFEFVFDLLKRRFLALEAFEPRASTIPTHIFSSRVSINDGSAFDVDQLGVSCGNHSVVEQDHFEILRCESVGRALATI